MLLEQKTYSKGKEIIEKKKKKGSRYEKLQEYYGSGHIL